MEGRSMEVPTNDAKKLFEIVLERERLLTKQEAEINCLKAAIDKKNEEIRDLEKKIKQVDWELKNFPSLEELKYIQKSIATATELTHTSILQYQTFEKLLKEKLEQRDLEIEKTKQECEKIYRDTEEKLKNTAEYQELEALKTEWLKLDIERRNLEVKRRIEKRIHQQQKDIADKLYYSEFVTLAENYLINQESEKLEVLKKREKEALQELYELQEKAKLNQQMGRSQKLSNLSQITLGNGQITHEKRIEKPVAVKIEQKAAVPKVQAFQDLSSLFAEPLTPESTVPSQLLLPQHESQPPSKLRILEQKIMAPSFAKQSAPPSAVPKEKRKKPVVIDVACQYRKIAQKLENNKLNTSMTKVLSQQSESGTRQAKENLSQQQSQSSQQCEKLTQSSQMSQHSGKLSQDAEAQQDDVPVQQSQTQLTTILIEDTQPTDTQMDTEVMEGEDEIPSSPPPAVKLQSIMKSAHQQKNPNKHFYANAAATQQSKKSVENDLFLKPSLPPISTVSESQKSVRFNMDSGADKQNQDGARMNKGLFGSDGFGFGMSNFSPFFNGKGNSSDPGKTSSDSSANNTMLNMSTDMNTTRMTEDRADGVASPDFLYEENKEETSQMGGFMSGFKGGFSFGNDIFKF